MLKRDQHVVPGDRTMRLVEASSDADRAVDAALGTFTVADLIATEPVSVGDPMIVTGREHLRRAIGWVRAFEPTGTRTHDRELVLARADDLGATPDERGSLIEAIAGGEVAGLVLQLDEQLTSAPLELVRACKAGDLPLIALKRPVRFAQVTETAHSHIVRGQQRLLKTTLTAHERFTGLSAAGASVEEVVAAVGEFTDGHVVFSNLMHQVLAVHAKSGGVEDALRRWGHCAGALTRSVGPQVDEDGQWAAVPVESRGRERGWLVHLSPALPDPTQPIVLERAAGALAMRMLLDDDETLLANAERTVLADLLAGRLGNADSIHARTAAIGHPTRDRYYLPITVIGDGSSDLRPALTRAVEETGRDALVGQLTAGTWSVLLLLDGADDCGADTFARSIARDCADVRGGMPTLGRGTVVSQLSLVARSFAESSDVAYAVRAVGAPKDRQGMYSIDDVKLRGLLYTLRDEPRLQAFVERSLGPLQLRDAIDGGQWVRTLAVYLRVNGNKSLAAQELGVSRPTLYERLARIQRLLQVDLEDSETTTSLFAAIMVVEATADVVPSLPAVANEGRHQGRGA